MTTSETEGVSGASKRTARARARARARFITVLARTCNVSEAARAAKISRDTAYTWRRSDKAFADLWADAEERARDRLEREAWRRGHDGVLEPVYQGGKRVGTIRRYSDRMLEILLKGHRPNRFGDRLELRGGLERPPEDHSARETARRMAFLLRAGEVAEKKQGAAPAAQPVALLPAPPKPEERRFRVVEPWDDKRDAGEQRDQDQPWGGTREEQGR